MKYTNEQIASLVIENDPEARSWVFNRHCRFCARFLFPEELMAGQCKKCRTKVAGAVERAVPFLSSATALQKLIVWTRTKALVARGTVYWDMHNEIAVVMTQWMGTTMSCETLHERIISIVGQKLSQIRAS